MSKLSVAPKPPAAKAPAELTLTLKDITLVDQKGERISGPELARLLAFARAWCPGWTMALELGDQEGPLELAGLAALIHHAEETSDVFESDGLHFIHGAIEVIAARVTAAGADAEKAAAEYRVEIHRASGQALDTAPRRRTA